jgi:hypothetical protein
MAIACAIRRHARPDRATGIPGIALHRVRRSCRSRSWRGCRPLSETYFNTNPDQSTSARSRPTPACPAGTSTSTSTTARARSDEDHCTKNTHVHEYDDKYNVTGVNMLQPSLRAFNLVNAIPARDAVQDPAGEPEDVAGGQDSSSAALTGVPVTSYRDHGGLDDGVAADVHTRGNVHAHPRAAARCVPVEGLGGTGDVRAGLVPTQTGCVHGNDGGARQTGPVDERRADDAGRQGDHAGLGGRVNQPATRRWAIGSRRTYLAVEPARACTRSSGTTRTASAIGDAGWVRSPQDTTVPQLGGGGAPGSDDPKDGCSAADGGFRRRGGTEAAAAQARLDRRLHLRRRQLGDADDDAGTRRIVTVTRYFSDGTDDSSHIPPPSGAERDAGPGRPRLLARTDPAVTRSPTQAKRKTEP